MKAYLFLFLLLILCPLFVFADNVRMTFTASYSTRILIARPIDGTINNYFFQDTLSVHPGDTVDYSLQMDEIRVVYVQQDNLKQFPVYVVPDADINICLDGKRPRIKGVDEPIIDYINNSFMEDLITYTKQLDTYFDRMEEKGDYSRFFQDSLPHFVVPSELAAESDSPFLVELLRNKVAYKECNSLVEHLQSVIMEKSDVLSVQDSLSMVSAMDSIFRSCLPKEDAGRYYTEYPYFMGYYRYLWTTFSDARKAELMNGYTDDTFGPYTAYLSAPHANLLQLFRDAFIVQFAYQANEFDKEDMLRFLHAKYPDSETYAICKRLYDGSRHRTPPVRIKEKVRSLADLPLLKDLKGKYIVVDLWATWCIPCRREMAYSSVLHEYADSLGNAVLLSLSIDEDEQIWEKNVEVMEGIHLRASEELLAEIKEKIYLGESVFIPRYFLLSPQGEILDKDLPRPSLGMEALKKRICDGIEKDKINESV